MPEKIGPRSRGHDAFRETRWSLIVRARHSPEILEELLRIYWAPVFSYVRAKGHNVNDAADLTQAFLTSVMLERNLVDAADPDRGRFRAFLKTALRRFLIDEHRRERGRGKTPVRFLPEQDDVLRHVVAADGEDPSEAFDRQWATTVLNAAIDRVRDRLLAAEADDRWLAFEARVLNPITTGERPPGLDEIAERIGGGVRSDQVSRMVYEVKQDLRLALRDIVAETVASAEDINEELGFLTQSLGI